MNECRETVVQIKSRIKWPQGDRSLMVTCGRDSWKGGFRLKNKSVLQSQLYVHGIGSNVRLKNKSVLQSQFCACSAGRDVRMFNNRLYWLFLVFLLVPLRVYAALPVAEPQSAVLSLEQCLRLAFSNSEAVQIAAQNVAKAQEGVKQAQSGFFPTLGYQFGYSNISGDLPVDGWPLGHPLYSPERVTKGSVTLTQPLYTAGKLTYGLKLAQLQLDSALENERKVKQDLTCNVKAAYYQVWVAEKMLTVARDALKNLDRHVDQVQKFYEAGTASKYDLCRAQVQRDTLKPPVIKAENAVVLVKLNLATLIGDDRERQFTVVVRTEQLQFSKEMPSQVAALLGPAYQNRVELRQVQLLKQGNDLKVALVRAEYQPNLLLTGNYGGKNYGGKDAGFAENWKENTTITLAIQGSLNMGGATRSKVAAAKDDQAIVLLQESALKNQIRLEVQQGVQAITDSLAAIRANQSNITLAQETLKYTQTRFDSGMATTIDIMDSQLALDQALNGYYQGIANYLIALAKLDQVVGKETE
jgi:outer membrane protein